MATHWKRRHSIGLAFLVLVVVLMPLLIPQNNRVVAFFFEVVLILLFTIVAGRGITGQAAGALIDERNQISLSRFQTLIWMTIILAGFLTMALCNLGDSQSPLAIAVPGELWSLIGISTASLVGSPLIRSVKEAPDPDSNEWDQGKRLLVRRFGGVEADYKNRGLVLMRSEPEAASWADLFLAEETGNAARLDLAKIQMFFFTVILVIAYTSALAAVMASDSAAIQEFPALTPGLVTLLGISHAGYLTNKVVPHSKTA